MEGEAIFSSSQNIHVGEKMLKASGQMEKEAHDCGGKTKR